MKDRGSFTMKKLLLPFVLLFSIEATAETPNKNRWVINDAGVAVVVEKASYNKFLVVGKCSGEPILFAYDLNTYKAADVGQSLKVKLRVDRGEILDTYGTLFEDNDTPALGIEDGATLVDDMKRGDTLRLAFRNNDNKKYSIIESYTLTGFTYAYPKIRDSCAQETQAYFPDDGDFF
jgi:hypothetical protein